MRAALQLSQLHEIYNRISPHYDLQHKLITAGSDQRGRRLVVEHAVKVGDHVLDCGAGTGSTALLAAKRVGPQGKVTLFDQSEGMLAVARQRLAAAGLAERTEIATGDILALPYPDNQFDAVLTTYSLCPLYDPARGALEMLRVLKPGGRLGAAHSVEPRRPLAHWLADRVEDAAWRLPSLSMGCRAVSVLPALQRAGARVLFERRIGIPLWPFVVFVVEKSQVAAH